MSLELISFKTCPFVQRAAITLAYKNLEFKLTFIDLADPPDFASSAMGGGTIQAISSGGSAVGQGPGGRVHVANAVAERTGVFTDLPVALDMSNPIVSRWNSGNRLREGIES